MGKGSVRCCDRIFYGITSASTTPPRLVIACCRAGIMGSFPTTNASPEVLGQAEEPEVGLDCLIGMLTDPSWDGPAS